MNCFIKILIPALVLFCFQSANANWVKQNSGTLAWLHSVYFANQDQGWIVGSSGAFLATTDGGKTWRQAKKFTVDNIRDVYFSDPQHGWLLCDGDIYAAGNNSPSYLLTTVDGGINWEKIKFTESKGRIARIFFSAKGRGFAVGESGAFWMLQDVQKFWRKMALPVRYLMLDGKFTDDLHGCLVGGGGTILFTEDGGLSWDHAMFAERNAKTKLNSIFFIDQNIGWTVGELGKIYFTSNGGKVWFEQSSNVTGNISDIFFLNSIEGFAVGDNGTILHTTTAGNVWNLTQINSKHKLEKVLFVNKKGFAVGFGGTILTYD